jgi:hypothetical protein
MRNFSVWIANAISLEDLRLRFGRQHVAFDRSSFEFFEESGRERGKREQRSSRIERFCSRIAELDLERKEAFL